MREYVHTFFAIALLAAGCATGPQFTSGNSQLWPWKQDRTSASSLLAQRPLARPLDSYAESGPASFGTTAPLRPGFDFSQPSVGRYVKRFQTDMRGFYERSLERGGPYISQMEAILRRDGVPTEIAYLPLIESGYRTSAVSRAGAVGPWQFMRATGRRYGLRIDTYVDERRDPVKSTEAAARYLGDLHEMFGDWHLALAAYNTGEANIARIIRRKGVDDYWEMKRRGYLYRETRHYVPRFLAALQIAQAPEVYGFVSPTRESASYEWVRVTKPLALAKVAEFTGTSTRQIKKLNPALRRGIVPRGGYSVKLPYGTKERFQVAYARADRKKLAARAMASAAPGTHKVRRGDTIGAIAQRYRVSSKALMRANNIRNARRLRIGQTLLIPGRGGVTATASANGRYRVRRGDTVGAIARRHGVSTKSLMRANRIRNARRLRIGQSLVIPGRGGVTAVASANGRYRVRRGDTVGAIARRHGVSVRSIMQANGIRNPRKLQVGDTLIIPGRPS
jgi:membrane-bound lytic murein transglycosylase D